MQTRIQRGLAFADSGKLDKAYEDLSAAIRDDPLSAKAYCCRGMVCLNGRQVRASIPDFTRAIELQPANALAYRKRAEAFKATGDLISAKADFMKYQELIKKFKDERNKELDRPDDLFGKPEQQAAANPNPAFQPFIDGWKAIKKKLDGILKK